MHHSRCQELNDALGFRLNYFRPGSLHRMIGIPFFHERCLKTYFQFLLDRLKSLNGRLNGWKGNSLSLVGRINLAQSALTNAHNETFGKYS